MKVQRLFLVREVHHKWLMVEVVSPKSYICMIWIRYSLCLYESARCV
nr:MAG TPA: hypothetical protein [Bacteriophage sp.]